MNSFWKVCRRVVNPSDYFRFVTNQRPELNIPAFEDLSGNVPGASLRQKSSEIQKAFPARAFLSKVLGVHTDERAWRRGAAGEEEVARQLDKLGPSWRVIHSVPVGSNETDIDHVVIGPPGVFTLNTKNHLGGRVTVTSKAIYVNGTFQPYLAKSRAEGKRATKLLTTSSGYEVIAQPMIVIMADELKIKGLTEGVHVVGRKRISRWLLNQRQTLLPEQVDSIYAVARHRSTWVS